jgi:hypothetical protein
MLYEVDRVTLAEQIKYLISRSEMPNYEIIRQLGISSAAFYKSINGNISLEMLLDILRVAGIPVSLDDPDPAVATLLGMYLEQRLEQEKTSKGARPYSGVMFILEYQRIAEARALHEQSAKTDAITE